MVSSDMQKWLLPYNETTATSRSDKRQLLTLPPHLAKSGVSYSVWLARRQTCQKTATKENNQWLAKKVEVAQQEAAVTDLASQVRQGLLLAGGIVPVQNEISKQERESHILDFCKALRQGLHQAGGQADVKDEVMAEIKDASDLASQVRQGLHLAGGIVPVQNEITKQERESHIHDFCKALRQGLHDKAGGQADVKDEVMAEIKDASESDASIETRVKEELLKAARNFHYETSSNEFNTSNNLAEQVRIGLQRAGEGFIECVIKDDLNDDKKEEKLANEAKKDFSSQLVSLHGRGNNDDWIMGDDDNNNDDDVSIVTLGTDTETNSDNSVDLDNFDVLEDHSMWLAK